MDYKPQSLSVIILAYNEERHLSACLEAIAAQTEAPDEVIVVNNNSTDNTVAIAHSYPFVTLIDELVQGMIPARNAGFAAAHGDILVRIDADAMLSPNWVQRVKQDFAKDAKLGGISGLADATLFAAGPWHGTFWSRMYFLMNDAYFRLPILWGANMAIRRQVWQDVKDDACLDDTKVHEDLDISLLMQTHGWRVAHDTQITIRTIELEYLQWEKVREYDVRRTSTLHHHQALGTFNRIDTPRMPFIKWLGIKIVMVIPTIVFETVSFVLYALKLPVGTKR